jgi:hypothetical protein
MSIGLAPELLLGRFKMPPARDPSALLARHEQGLFNECLAVIKEINCQPYSTSFNDAIFTRCQPLIEAIGQRMAYEAAFEAGVNQDLLALYETGVILQDSSWYVQHAGLTREAQFERESRALSACLPCMKQMLDQTGAKEFTTSPILSPEAWAEFVASLETFGPPPRDAEERGSDLLVSG